MNKRFIDVCWLRFDFLYYKEFVEKKVAKSDNIFFQFYQRAALFWRLWKLLHFVYVMFESFFVNIVKIF